MISTKWQFSSKDITSEIKKIVVTTDFMDEEIKKQRKHVSCTMYYHVELPKLYLQFSAALIAPGKVWQ